MNDSNPFESPQTLSAGVPVADGGSEFAPCPNCSSTSAKVLSFTWWGGVLGPKMLSHVKCLACGTRYNGKTGRSNLRAIIVYQAVGMLIAVVLMVMLFGLR